MFACFIVSPNVTCFLFVRIRMAALLNAVQIPYVVFRNACCRFCIVLIVGFVDGVSPYLRFVGFRHCCAFVFCCCDAFLEEEIVLL